MDNDAELENLYKIIFEMALLVVLKNCEYKFI